MLFLEVIDGTKLQKNLGLFQWSLWWATGVFHWMAPWQSPQDFEVWMARAKCVETKIKKSMFCGLCGLCGLVEKDKTLNLRKLPLFFPVFPSHCTTLPGIPSHMPSSWQPPVLRVTRSWSGVGPQIHQKSKEKHLEFGHMLIVCHLYSFVIFTCLQKWRLFGGPKRLCIASFNKVHCPKVPVWSQPPQRAVQPRVLLRHPPQRWCRWVAIAPWRYGRPWRRWMGWETSRAETTWLKGMGREWKGNGRRLHEAEMMFPLEIAPARFATYPKIDGCLKWRDDMIKQKMRKDEKLQTTKNYFYDHDGCQHLASRQVVTTPSAPAPPAPLLARRQISMTSGRPKCGTFCLHEPHMPHVLLSYEAL